MVSWHGRIQILFLEKGHIQILMLSFLFWPAVHEGGHTVGLAHCSTFAGRLRPTADPTLSPRFAAQLQAWCPPNVDPRTAVPMDTVTPRAFDNQYFKNLQGGMGLLSSDQLLFTDSRSRPTVDAWARSGAAFDRAFVAAITKLGRVGVKTDASQGNIRHNCAAFNWIQLLLLCHCPQKNE